MYNIYITQSNNNWNLIDFYILFGQDYNYNLNVHIYNNNN